MGAFSRENSTHNMDAFYDKIPRKARITYDGGLLQITICNRTRTYKVRAHALPQDKGYLM